MILKVHYQFLVSDYKYLRIATQYVLLLLV